MANNKLANLKSQLLTSGLSQKDQPLFQVISQLIQFLQDLGIEVAASSSSGGGGGSALAITGLNTDVVATGPGNVVATIQPNVVTYNKIQQVTGLRLVGNPDAALQDMVEIPLGDNLAFLDGFLTVEVTPGVPGVLHRLLSPTHSDTIPNEPIEGDIIYATVGVPFDATFIYAQVVNPVKYDAAVGIYGLPYLGFGNGIVAPVCGSTGINIFDNIANEAEDSLPTPDIWDGFVQVLLVISETGIYGIPYTNTPGAGNYFSQINYPFTLVVPPDPLPDYSSGTWTRKGIGSEGQVLTVVDGIPEWENLPPIPAEPAYPWTDITFNAADFTAAGGVGPTWTVAAGDVERYQRQNFPGSSGVGNNVRIAIYLRATTVGGTAPTQLIITLPFSIIGRFAQFVSIQENGAASNDVFVEYDEAVSVNQLTINKIAGAVFDTTAAGTFLAFEISAVLAP